jgi:hypothetical protein
VAHPSPPRRRSSAAWISLRQSAGFGGGGRHRALHLRERGARGCGDARLHRRWTSDTEIRAQNEFTTFGYAKDYDAVVTVRLDGCEPEFALEYERTPKAGKKYQQIRQAIESGTRLTTFLYPAVNFHVLNFVAQFFERSRKPVYFGLLNEFLSSQLEMRVLDVTRRTHMR